MERSQKVELNLHIVFGRLVFFLHNFQQQETFYSHLLDSTLRKAGQKSSHHIYLSRPGCKKIYRYRKDKNCPVSFFILSRLSYKQPVNVTTRKLRYLFVYLFLILNTFQLQLKSLYCCLWVLFDRLGFQRSF